MGQVPDVLSEPLSTQTPHTQAGVGSAHAKVILLGEHAVLHSQPAIAGPIRPLRLRAKVTRSVGPLVVAVGNAESAIPGQRSPEADAVRTICRSLGVSHDGITVSITNDIPYARGLGSSAAFGLALVRALAAVHDRDLTRSQELSIVADLEKTAHGTASGIDACAAAESRDWIWFQNGQARSLRVSPGCVAALLVIDTGVPSSTRAAVRAVTAQITRHDSRCGSIFDRIGQLVAAGAEHLQDGEMGELGSVMSKNHHLLQELQLSTPALDRLTEAAMSRGALGAKLTGGGRGGCIVALCASHASANAIGKALASRGAYWVVDLTANRFADGH